MALGLYPTKVAQYGITQDIEFRAYGVDMGFKYVSAKVDTQCVTLRLGKVMGIIYIVILDMQTR